MTITKLVEELIKDLDNVESILILVVHIPYLDAGTSLQSVCRKRDPRRALRLRYLL